MWASVGRRARQGGGDGWGGPAGILFSPARGGEATVLEEGIGDHGHQRVAMQTLP